MFFAPRRNLQHGRDGDGDGGNSDAAGAGAVRACFSFLAAGTPLTTRRALPPPPPSPSAPLQYLSQQAAQQIDQELMAADGGGFALEQLMELAGLGCAQAIFQLFGAARVLVCCGGACARLCCCAHWGRA